MYIIYIEIISLLKNLRKPIIAQTMHTIFGHDTW